MRRRNDATGMTLNDAFVELRSDYDAAKNTRYLPRLRGVSPTGSGADYHYRTQADFLRMMERARTFDRNNMIVGQAITRLIDNVLQDGIAPDPQTGSAELDQECSQRWEPWSSDADQCHAAREHNFHALARMSLRSVIVDGDMLHLPLADGRLQPVEAHRLRTPHTTKRNVVHGVLLNEQREPLEYWITKEDVDPLAGGLKVKDIRPYKARDGQDNRQVFHVYDPKRFSQTRGVTAFAPIVYPAGLHDDLQFANLVRAQVSACYNIMHTYVLGAEPGGSQQRGNRETETRSDGSQRTLEGIAPGMELWAQVAGEQITGFTPNVPNPSFFEHASLLLSIIAVNLDLPVVVLLLDATKTNFSGWRGAVDQARIGFRRIQRWMIDRLYRPVYLWRVRDWLQTDERIRKLAGYGLNGDGTLKRLPGAAAGVNVFRHNWNPPTWSYIEPLKDASADLLRLRNALISHRRRAAERGMDWNDLSGEIVDDNALLVVKAHEKAVELNKQHPELKITWRELASLPTPDGVRVQVNTGGGDGTE